MVSPLPATGRVEAVRAWCKQHRVAAHCERWFPYGLAALAGALTCCWNLDPTQMDRLVGTVVPVAISVAAILAGFQTTAQSVMLALLDSSSAKFLRRTGHYDTLIGFHWAAITSLLAFIGVALGILAAKAIADAINQHGRLVPSVLSLLFVLAVAASFRVMHLMFKLLRTKMPLDESGHGSGGQP